MLKVAVGRPQDGVAGESARTKIASDGAYGQAEVDRHVGDGPLNRAKSEGRLEADDRGQQLIQMRFRLAISHELQRITGKDQVPFQTSVTDVRVGHNEEAITEPLEDGCSPLQDGHQGIQFSLLLDLDHERDLPSVLHFEVRRVDQFETAGGGVGGRPGRGGLEG